MIFIQSFQVHNVNYGSFAGYLEALRVMVKEKKVLPNVFLKIGHLVIDILGVLGQTFLQIDLIDQLLLLNIPEGERSMHLHAIMLKYYFAHIKVNHELKSSRMAKYDFAAETTSKDLFYDCIMCMVEESNDAIKKFDEIKVGLKKDGKWTKEVVSDSALVSFFSVKYYMNRASSITVKESCHPHKSIIVG
jgi:hypothetical protein